MDGSLLELIQQWIIEFGPWIVYLVTMLETAAFIGLFVPSGPTILFAAFLTTTRFFEFEHVLLATLLGGFSGDQLGYGLGRAYGVRGIVHGGRVGRLWHRYEHRAVTLFRRHSVVAVSLARCIAFVRTIMPWFAGMSRMPYGRFVFYDVAGVLVWGIGHVTLGYVAGRGWRALATLLGSATLAILTAVAIVALVVYLRRRRRGDTPAEEQNGLFRVGLTGNIASGKSAVEAIWTSLGAHVVDADVLAREAVEPGSEGLQRVVAHFGPEVLQPDGSLDRAAMRDIVFRDEAARVTLESIVHPEVEQLRRAREDALREQGVRIVVHAIPLLFEVGMEHAFDVVVLVDAPEEERLRRLVEIRNLQEDEAQRMIAAQMPAAEKRERATLVIENDGTLADLEQRAVEAWREIERRAGVSA
ncbi:MAG: dephospho-CoA kinase [Candidatus Cloacimonetes bacterium]|nr:dephospho-CoA kinase [Candidatus Cloacimonadota bacterium]